MKNSIKDLKNYFQMIMTAVTCFVMGFAKIKDQKCVCQNSARRHEERKTGCLNALWKSLGMGMCFVYETPKAKMISEYIVKETDHIYSLMKKRVPGKIKLFTGMSLEFRTG